LHLVLEPYTGPKNLIDVNRPNRKPGGGGGSGTKSVNDLDSEKEFLAGYTVPNNVGGGSRGPPQRPQRPPIPQPQRRPPAPPPQRQPPPQRAPPFSDQDGYSYPRPMTPFTLPGEGGYGGPSTTRRPQATVRPTRPPLSYPDIPTDEDFGIGQNSEENKNLLGKRPVGQRPPQFQPPPSQRPSRPESRPPFRPDPPPQNRPRPGPPERPFRPERPESRPPRPGPPERPLERPRPERPFVPERPQDRPRPGPLKDHLDPLGPEVLNSVRHNAKVSWMRKFTEKIKEKNLAGIVERNIHEKDIINFQ